MTDSDDRMEPVVSEEVVGTPQTESMVSEEPMPIADGALPDDRPKDGSTPDKESSPKEPAPPHTPEGDEPAEAEGAAGVGDEAGPTNTEEQTQDPLTPANPTPEPRKKPFSWGWLIVLALALLLVGGGFGFYAVSNMIAHASWESTIASNDSVAVLALPSLNNDKIPILEGTSLETLRQGVGWYDGTAAPGEVGNFVLAGHRLGWGQPFANIGQLRIGDFITVSLGTTTYTYGIVTAPTVVAGDDATILNPVPGGPDMRPTRSLITLTTAASLLPSPERLVVVGELVED